MTNRNFVAVASALITLTAGAFRPVGGQMIRIGFGGGVSVPTSHAADALKGGVNGQAYVLLNLIGIPLRFNVGYQKFDYKQEFLNGVGGGATSGTSSMLSGVGGLSINLFTLGPFTPYVMAGLGAFDLKDEIQTGSVSTSTSKLNYGIDGGGGLRLKLGRLEAFAEGRVQNVYTSTGGYINKKSITAIPVTFGILF